MSEQERPAQEPKEVTSLHFDFKSRRLVGLFEDQSALQFTLTPDLKLMFNGYFQAPGTPEVLQRQEVMSAPTESAPQAVPPVTTEAPKGPEKQPIQTLTGRLKDDVKPGRVDSRGNPTSWSIAAVHEEGQETAKMVAVSFHRHTAQLAIEQLHKDDQVTIQGYLRPSNNPERLDAFSAFHLINYPNKPKDEKAP